MTRRIERRDRRQDCHAGRDGDCFWKYCPQGRDNEPSASGRSCPLAGPSEWDDPEYAERRKAARRKVGE